MDWFRSYHGAPTDPKWLLIARKAQTVPGVVSAVWFALEDYASQHKERGSVLGFDTETLAAFFGWEQEVIERVIFALQEKNLIGPDGVIAGWDRSQPRGRGDGRPHAAEWEAIRRRIFARDNYTCRYCRRRGVRLECDHIIPISRGGGNDDSNLATACRPCNRSKYDRTPDEWKGGVR